MTFRSACLATAIVIAASTTSRAALQTKEVTYQHGDLECHGFLAWDDAFSGPRPGVLVVHEWWGLNLYARERASKLAQLGCIAFAADMYGEGKKTEHPQEAGKMAAEVRKNMEDWVGRAKDALEVLKSQPQCDQSKLAAIGYCFGGSTVLQLAFSGADLQCVVSFHGALPVPSVEQARKTKATVIVCHGAEDGFIKEETIQQFRKVLDEAGVDWEMDYYAGAKHSFTVASVDERHLDGMAYNAEADRRSWNRMLAVFQEKLAFTLPPAP